MQSHRFFLSLITISVLTGGVSIACAQNFPTRPIRIVAPEVGGGGDLAARLIAQGISGPLGQQVIVENRSQTQAGELVVKAAPDGYTILLASASFTLGSLLRTTPYDPINDFAPITLPTRAPNVLTVHPSLPAKSVKELIALGKARPGELNFGSGATGGGTFLAAELLKSMAGIDLVRIPFRGDGPSAIGLLTGQIHVAFLNLGSVSPYVKSGRLRVIGVGSAQPTPLLPGVPAVAATLPGFESVALTVMVAPVKTPNAIITRLNREIVQVLNKPDVKEKFASMGTETVGGSPEELTIAMKNQIAQAARVIKGADIRGD